MMAVMVTDVEVKAYTPREVRMKLAELQMSRRTFAELVGLSDAHLSTWLSEKYVVGRLARLRIAEVMEALESAPTAPDGTLAPKIRRL